MSNVVNQGADPVPPATGLPGWETGGPLPSLGSVIALGTVGLAGVALSIFGIVDTGSEDELRRIASVVGLVSGLVTLVASAVAANRRRRGLFDAARRIEYLQRLYARVQANPALRGSDEVRWTLDHARNLADELADAGAFQESVAVHRAIANVEDIP
jgi:hypothetical protein